MAGYNGIQILRGNTTSIQGKELLEGQPLFIKDKNYLIIGRGDESKIPVSTRELKGYTSDNSGVTSSTEGEFHVLYDGSKSLLDIKSPAGLNAVATSINIAGSGGIDLSTSGALSFTGMTWQEDVSNKTVDVQAVFAANVGDTAGLNVGDSLKFAIDGANKKLSVTGDLNVTTSNINISSANLNFNASSGSNIRFDLGEYGAKLNIGKDITAMGSNINFTATGDVSSGSPSPIICLNTATLQLETPADTSTYTISSASDVNITANGTTAVLGNFRSSSAGVNVGLSLTLPSRTITYKVGSVSYYTSLPSISGSTLATKADIDTFYAHRLEVRCTTNDNGKFYGWSSFKNFGGDFRGGMFYVTLYCKDATSMSGSDPTAFFNALSYSYAYAATGLWYTGNYNIIAAMYRSSQTSGTDSIYFNVIPFSGAVQTLEYKRSDLENYTIYITDHVNLDR